MGQLSHSDQDAHNRDLVSSSWYRGLYDKIPCPCFIVSVAGMILDANPFACQSLGYETEELVQNPLCNILHPEDQSQFIAALTTCSQCLTEVVTGELRLFTLTGDSLLMRVTFDRLSQTAQEPLLLLVCENLIKHREQEEASEAQAQVQLLADAFLGKVSYVDSQKRYRLVSKRYEEWSKVPVAAVLGKAVDEFMLPHQYQKIERYVDLALEGNRVSYEFDLVFGDGKHRYLLADHIPHISQSGKVLGFFVFCQDITERKKAEQILQQFNVELEAEVRVRTSQLQQALDLEALLKRITDKVRDTLDENQILQTVVQEVSQGLGVVRCDTGLYDLKQATSTIYSEYQIAGERLQGCLLHMADLPELYSQMLQNQCLQFCELIPSPPGRTTSELFTVLACPIFDTEGVIGDLWLFRQPSSFFDDMEVRLVRQVANQCAIAIRQSRLYQAAQSQVEELERLNHLKDDFLSTVSHELRAPMTNMRMSLEMLSVALRQNSTLPPEDRVYHYLRILKEECARETGLINDLLNLQRLEAGEESLTLEQLDLRTWLPHVVEPFQERVQAQHQSLHSSIDPNLPPLLCDRSSLERILIELLNNACKYTPSGGQITLTAHASGDTIQLKVANSGTEIPPDELPHIFEKFYRVPHLDRWKHGGTGLGLALVQKLAEHSGGKITVESDKGQTCFTVELPVDPSTPLE
jgi:PAS domain S-box-containing protein